jgi:hypothetical protein
MSTFRRLADVAGAPYLQIDHLRLIQSPEWTRDFAMAAKRSATISRYSLVDVAHENDGSCCRRELWPATCRRLLRVLADRRQTSSAYVSLVADR